MDHLSVPLLFIFYISCYKNKWWYAALAASALAFVKEPFALMTLFCGVYLILRWRRIGIGIFLSAFGIFYFYIATVILIPNHTSVISGCFDGNAFSWLGTTPLDMLLFILTHPLEILKEIVFNQKKLIYCLTLLGALSFIPLFSPYELIPAIPVLSISLLSRLDNYYGIGHHYTVGLIAPMIISFAIGYPKAKNYFIIFVRKYVSIQQAHYIFTICILSCMLIAHIMISPSPISRLFWTNKVWSYGYDAYIPTKRNKVIKNAIKKYIPDDINVGISTQNTLNWWRLSHRKHYYSFPVGTNANSEKTMVFSAGNENVDIMADYVLIDLKRPWYLEDIGCNIMLKKPKILSGVEKEQIGIKEDIGPLKWAGCTSPKFYDKYINSLSKVLKIYSPVFEHDGFVIFKKQDHE
jgi:uncharacterized membrane protein